MEGRSTDDDKIDQNIDRFRGDRTNRYPTTHSQVHKHTLAIRAQGTDNHSENYVQIKLLTSNGLREIDKWRSKCEIPNNNLCKHNVRWGAHGNGMDARLDGPVGMNFVAVPSVFTQSRLNAINSECEPIADCSNQFFFLLLSSLWLTSKRI